jgi:ferredoxin
LAATRWHVRDFFSSLILHRGKFDLLQIGIINRLLKHRAFQYAAMMVNLFVFWVIILSGFFGSPVGNRNISIVFVWILWWFALIVLMVPLLSRIWCTMCPLPAFGEWLERRALVKKRSAFKYLSLRKPWPSKLNNIWLQNLGFLAIATFSALLVTRPVVTAIVLLILFVVPVFLVLIYSRRVFCRFICPVGGFLGLFSMFSALELRPKDKTLCRNHMTKECVRGNDNGYGCPWIIYPGGLERNNYCGLCFECIKTCPYNNLALNLRSFGGDILAKTGRALDEAWKSFIMLTLAGLYILVMQGPWGVLKDWSNVFWAPPYGWALTGVGGFLPYVGIFWGLSLAVTPSVFFLFTGASKLASGVRSVPLKKLFIDFSYELIPLALMAWIAFSIPLLLVNWSYIVNALLDPVGLGWNVFSGLYVPWTPLIPAVIPYLQSIVLAVGLAYSIKYSYRLAKQNFPEGKAALKAFLPQVVFLTFVSMIFLWLFMG